MATTLVLYYSNTGSNKYLAERFASEMACDIEEVQPRIKSHMLLMFLGGLGLGIKQIKSDLSSYDKILFVSPIWMGQLVYPVRAFLKKYKNKIDKFYFATCCGSKDAMKDDKFGHGLVFNKIAGEIGNKFIYSAAFPVDLVLPDEKKDDDKLLMATRLSDSNFKGEILERFNKYVTDIS